MTFERPTRDVLEQDALDLMELIRVDMRRIQSMGNRAVVPLLLAATKSLRSIRSDTAALSERLIAEYSTEVSSGARPIVEPFNILGEAADGESQVLKGFGKLLVGEPGAVSFGVSGCVDGGLGVVGGVGHDDSLTSGGVVPATLGDAGRDGISAVPPAQNSPDPDGVGPSVSGDAGRGGAAAAPTVQPTTSSRRDIRIEVVLPAGTAVPHKVITDLITYAVGEGGSFRMEKVR